MLFGFSNRHQARQTSKMTTDNRRTIIGRILLAVYLTILAVGALHVHEHVEEDFECQDCINHVNHTGHISEGDKDMGDCLLCSFYSINYIGVQCSAILFVSVVLRRDYGELTASVVCRTNRTILLRGPPASL